MRSKIFGWAAVFVGVFGAFMIARKIALASGPVHTAPVVRAGTALEQVDAALAAAGSSKTDCTALTKEFSEVTGTSLQGVCLLTAAAGQHQVIYNSSAVTLVLYPLDAGNDTIALDGFAALAADVGVALGPKVAMDCTAYTTTAWFCKSAGGAQSTVAGAGTTEADDTELTVVVFGGEVHVTGNNGVVGIALPPGTLEGCVRINASGATATNTLKVYAATADDADSINGVDGDTAYVQGATASVRYCTADGAAWLTY